MDEPCMCLAAVCISASAGAVGRLPEAPGFLDPAVRQLTVGTEWGGKRQ